MAAKLKIDQEMLKKHRFWFLIPVVALALLIGWICVLGVRSDAATNFQAAKSIDDQLRSLRSNPDKRNQMWLDGIRAKKMESQEQKNRLWIAGFDSQNQVVREGSLPPPSAGGPATDLLAVLPPIQEIRNPLITWPEASVRLWELQNLNRTVRFLDFGEWLRLVPEEYKDHYQTQFDRALDVLPWYNETSGQGSVRVLDGTGNHRTRAMDLLDRKTFKTGVAVLSEEAWVLQEDLAVRRELLKVLGEVVDRRAEMHPEWQALASRPAENATAAAAPGGAPAAAATPPRPTRPANEISLDSKSFYNYVWTAGLVPLTETARAEGTADVDPSLEPWRGWRLDLELVAENDKLSLRGNSTNLSARHALPKQRLAVYFIEAGSLKEMDRPVIIEDAGDLPVSTYNDEGALARAAEKSLARVPVPTGALRISRVTRATDGDVLDAFYGFNREWVLELELRGTASNTRRTLTGSLFNRSDRRQRVPAFTMVLSDGTTDQLPERVRIPVDELNASARRAFNIELENRAALVRVIKSLKQELDWRTVPIKRVDRLIVGIDAQKQSDRLRVAGLVPYDFAAKDPRYIWKAESPPPGAPMGEPPQPRSISANHDIVLRRYLEVTPEVRRLPITLVLVVDAAHANDILTAMSNSRLRFQVTQAVWNRIPSLGRPPSPADATASDGTGTGTPSGSGGGGGGFFGGGGQTPQGGGLTGRGGGSRIGGGGAGAPPIGGDGGTRPPGSAPPTTRPPAGGPAGADGPARLGIADDSHVVQIQIYGLVTLYESPDAFKRLQEMKTKR